MNEPCRLRRGERYEVCEDALKGLGCCPARKTQFFASGYPDAQLAKYEIDLFVRWQAARGMAIAAHCLPSTRHYSGVIYPSLSVLTQLFFLRILKAQDDNDTDADALDRASASCIDSSKPTPGYAGGKKELIARGEVDKKKAPHYSRSGLPTTQLQ